MQPRRPNRTLRESGSLRPGSLASWPPSRIPIRWYKGKDSPFSALTASRSKSGPGAGEAIELNQPFFTRMLENRPFVILKAAISQDGYIARRRSPNVLTSEAANRHAHLIRAEIDAIGVGVGTVCWLTIHS